MDRETDGGGEAMPPPSIDFFISHQSDDEIAHELFHLIRDEIYGGDVEETTRRVFFSSDGDTGLRAGEHFGTMLERLQAAKRVVAIVTPRSHRSTAVQTEMALAQHHKKLLPVVAIQAYRSLLTWPFESMQAPSLDSPTDVRGLVRQLSEIAGRKTKETATTIERCKTIAECATRTCPDPTRRKWWPMAVAAAILGVIAVVAFFAGQASVTERRYTIAEGEALDIDGSTMTVVVQTTFPRMLLSTRLNEISAKLGRDTPSTTSGELLNAALEDTKRMWGLNPQALQRLKSIVERWDGSMSKLVTARGKGCSELDVDIDREWCSAVQGSFSEGASKTFDATPFAVVRLDPDARFYALTSDNVVPGRKTWKVEKIGGVTVRIVD